MYTKSCKALVLFVSCFTFLTLAVSTFANSPERTLDDDVVKNIGATIEHAKSDAGASNLNVALIVWARGIQSYELRRDGWEGTGPLADLLPLEVRNNGTVRLRRNKIGSHYQHQASPAWEFDEGRVIAQSASAIPGASDQDVAWLDVDLQPNDLGFIKILRIETRSGLAPNNTNYIKNSRVGVGYETIYVFLN